jgi:hypothetical protein
MAAFGLCSMCRKEIALGGRFYKCTVSSCNSGRTKLYFCSPACWDAHLPTARHRSAGYIEATATKE